MAKLDRPRRTNINGKRNVLTIQDAQKDPKFVYRFVNDTDSRIQNFEEIGYEIVRDSSIKVGDKRVDNPSAEGSPVVVSKGSTRSFLMRIKKEYYEEDQAAKAKAISETEAGMKAEAQSQGMYGKLEISRS